MDKLRFYYKSNTNASIWWRTSIFISEQHEHEIDPWSNDKMEAQELSKSQCDDLYKFYVEDWMFPNQPNSFFVEKIA